MRWCFVSPGFRSINVLNGDTRTSGGAEAQVACLAAALARLGHQVSLVYGDGQGAADQRVVAGVTCIDAAPAWRRPASLIRFWRAMDVLRPDLLYARLPSDFLWMMGLFARKRRGIRFVYAIAHDLHCASSTAYDYNRWFHAPLYALGLYSAHLIAIQHMGQRELLSRVLRKRLASVPNLVRSIRDQPRTYEATSFDAIWIARVRPEKRIELFLDLAASLPDLRFAVVGGFDTSISTTLRVSLEKRMHGIGNLSFFGPQHADDVVDLISRSRVLVNTSSSEGFPNTMLEAWSVGVPVVTLSVDPGGVIEKEQLGFVSWTMASLVRDVEALARTAPLNRRLGSHGLAYVRRRHSLEAVCEAFAPAEVAAGAALVNTQLPSNG
jgi:glycosyltransferase involved in cell wall biosynthesis